MKNSEILAKETKFADLIGIPRHHVGLVGSTLVCGSGKDEDFLCFVESAEPLILAGFSPEIDLLYDSHLHSYRKDGLNAIAVYDWKFFLVELAIAHAAKKAACPGTSLSGRSGRVDFHSEVRSVVLSRCEDEEDHVLDLTF